MFCQKCGKQNADDATFCNSCGANLNNIRTPIAEATPNVCAKCGKPFPAGAAFCPDCGRIASLGVSSNSIEIQQKENEVRLLQEKFDNEASHLGPIVLAIIGVITMIIVVGIVLIFIAWAWDKSRSAKATETEIQLTAAKTELQKMRGDAVITSPPTPPTKNKRAIFFCGAIIIGIVLALIVGWVVFAAASYGGAAITNNWTKYCNDNYPGSTYNPSTNTCQNTASPPEAVMQVTSTPTPSSSCAAFVEGKYTSVIVPSEITSATLETLGDGKATLTLNSNTGTKTYTVVYYPSVNNDPCQGAYNWNGVSQNNQIITGNFAVIGVNPDKIGMFNDAWGNYDEIDLVRSQ